MRSFPIFSIIEKVPIDEVQDIWGIKEKEKTIEEKEERDRKKKKRGREKDNLQRTKVANL